MPEDISNLIEALSVPERKAEAVERLAQMGEAAVPTLIQTLDHKKYSAREAAAQALGRIGAKAVAPLALALGRSSFVGRWLAAQALGAIGPEAKAAVPALLQALQDPCSGVCCRAAEALERIDPETAIPPEFREFQEEMAAARKLAMDLIAAPLDDEDEEYL